MVKTIRQSGQALVLVLLSLAVIITIVLFVLGRTVTDISLSGSESQSVSAFSAAEAGVEQALVIGSGSGGDVSINSTTKYNASVTDYARATTSFVYPVEVNSGDNVILWLQSQDGSLPASFTGGTLKVCWGKNITYSNLNLQPAVEVSVYYQTTLGNAGTTRIYRVAADPYNLSRSPSNTFSASAGSCTVNGQTFPFSTTLNLGPTGANLPLSNMLFADVRMFYNTDTSHPVAFDSAGTSQFPKQGILVESSGTSGQSSRKVQVFQSWPEIPNAFLFGVYSPSGLTK